MRYEWDRAKAASNLRLHGVDFVDRIEEADDRFDYSEERDVVIGMARGGVLFVVVTNRGENTKRIISARKAKKHKQDRYHAGDHENW